MSYLDEMEQYARANKIPVILPETRVYLENLCREIKPKRILEIGMAIGYYFEIKYGIMCYLVIFTLYIIIGYFIDLHNDKPSPKLFLPSAIMLSPI